MRNFLILLSLLALQASGCHDEKRQQVHVSQAEIQEDLIAYNRKKVERENSTIEHYNDSLNLGMQKSPTGLRYVIDHTGEGDSISFGSKIEVDYSIYLLDSTLCYSSDLTGTRMFSVEESDEMPGMHELVQRMRVGDKARGILPSRLGYGFTGDIERIPQDAVLLIDVHVVRGL